MVPTKPGQGSFLSYSLKTRGIERKELGDQATKIESNQGTEGYPSHLT